MIPEDYPNSNFNSYLICDDILITYDPRKN